MLLKLKLAVLSAMLIAGLGLGSYANADQTPAPAQSTPSSPGMMQDDMGHAGMSSSDMKGMGDMMGQMMQMMSLCNQMMQTAMQHPATPAQPVPPTKGSGG